MKLAFSTNAFKQVSLEESLREIAACGYAGVEIMADVPHAYPPHMECAQGRSGPLPRTSPYDHKSECVYAVCAGRHVAPVVDRA